MPVKLEAHEWVREQREDKSIRQSDVEERTAQMGPRRKISQSHLSKIEKGRAPLTGLGPERMDALREVLGISPEEWTAATGLQIVTAPPPESEPTRSVSSTRRVELPEGLRVAIELYGKRFSELLDIKWQNYLAGFQWRNGQPEDPEAWLDLYRDLSRAGVVPGDN